MLQIRQTDLDGVLELLPRRFEDERGWFCETWNRERLAENGINLDFVQDNHSYSHELGVLRGLHYQSDPFAQDKLVRVVSGRIFDVAVDLRKGSPRFAEWVGVELSAEKSNQLLIPRGFAHGFVTLEPDCHVLYKVTSPYSKACDRSIRFDDPAIGISWPIDPARLILSEKDRKAPLLADANNEFIYAGAGS